jgi:hypothetical protein
MRHIGELHLNYPFAGSRMLRGLLWQQGLEVGRQHIKTLMRKMGVEAIYRKPNTSKPYWFLPVRRRSAGNSPAVRPPAFGRSQEESDGDYGSHIWPLFSAPARQDGL